MKTTTPARVLSALATRWSATAQDIAKDLGMSKPTVIRHLRKLATQGFVFCNDDFDGRERSRGRYSNALWVVQGETSGFTPEAAQGALNDWEEGVAGLDILFRRELCC